MIKSRGVYTAVLIVCMAACVCAQSDTEDNRTQYPVFLKNSYFGLNAGTIGYGFSARQLEPTFTAESIEIPRPAVRVDLFGHYFSRYVSAQVSYMRPGRFVAYHNVNGQLAISQVWAAYGGLSLAGHVPLSRRLSGYAEGGLGITSRTGFSVNGVQAVRDAHFSSGLLGGGFEYHVTPKIDIVLGGTYLPGRRSYDQPATRLITSGFRINLRPLPPETVESNREAGIVFPTNTVRFAYTNNVTYGVNNFLSDTVHIFWSGHAEVKSGVTAEYERNFFHTKRRFAFDLGASASAWTSNGANETFQTLSAYPLFRFFLARTRGADVYAAYSLAGPTYITRKVVDGQELGEHFTFQDFVAAGAFIGSARRINLQVAVKHFSNGNMFPRNPGVKIPLTLGAGMTF